MSDDIFDQIRERTIALREEHDDMKRRIEALEERKSERDLLMAALKDSLALNVLLLSMVDPTYDKSRLDQIAAKVHEAKRQFGFE